MSLLLSLKSFFKLTKYPNPGGKFLSTDEDGVLVLADAPAGTNALTFTESNLVSIGGGFYKLPLVLTGTKCILAVKIAISGGDTYQKPASDWINDEIINFDSNTTQTITVITS